MKINELMKNVKNQLVDKFDFRCLVKNVFKFILWERILLKCLFESIFKTF